MEEPAAASTALLQFSTSHVRVTLPELSRSQTTLDESPDAPTSIITKRKSLRIRPAEALQQQHAVMPSPLRPTTILQPELRSRSSKMSLFSLFSKPKVEKQRGYAEAGLETLPAQRAMSLSTAGSIKVDIGAPVQHSDIDKDRLRPTSSKSYASKKSRTYMSKEPLPPVPNERQSGQSDLLPLFQVWPQTIKSATLEVSTSSSEVSVQRPRNRIAEALLAPSNEVLANAAGYRGGSESRAKRPSRNGSISSIALPKKVIVLTTSGQLLQYAGTGASDRFPEKILQIGKDSAAFASDLIPGCHHVLQVSQAVDSCGISVIGSQSLLSRFSIRRLPTSRMASTFLLVMSGPEELNDWMSAVKKSIEEHGGKRARSDSVAARPRSRHPQPQAEVTTTPSHRFQVKRDLGGPAALKSPTLEALPSPSPPLLRLDAANKDSVDSSMVPHASEYNMESVDTVDADNESIKTRPRAPSDCPSISSSAALSVEQQQLEKLRNSIRISRTSTVATSVTAASRTNSVNSSPSDQSKESADCHGASSSLTLAKRRSAVPLSLKDLPEGTNSTTLVNQQRLGLAVGVVDSPILGSSPPLPHPSRSAGPNRASLSRNISDLQSKTLFTANYGSKLPSLQDKERPASFIADLPDVSLRGNKPSANESRPSSSIPFPPLLETATSTGHRRTNSGTPRTSPTSRPLRSGSNSFSLPRALPVDSSPPRVQQRSASDAQEESVLSPVPAVHTLTAKVDVATRTKIDVSYIPARKSSTSGSPPNIRAAKRSSTAKLSLFPSAQSAPPPIFPQPDILRRSPSAVALSSHMQTQIHTTSAANPRRLARPASLQVRANYAPFASAMRGNNPADPRSFPTTAPIRSLKPSRSIATMQTTTTTIATAPSPSPSALSSFTPRSLHTEPIDETTPLSSPFPRPSSRTRKSPRVSTQSIDISSLGPPAPPPLVPLPEVPGANGSPERRGSQDRPSVTRSGTPIGVAIGEALEHKVDIPPRRGSVNKTSGLGIAVVEEEKLET